jgi:hypothetical protein
MVMKFCLRFPLKFLFGRELPVNVPDMASWVNRLCVAVILSTTPV